MGLFKPKWMNANTAKRAAAMAKLEEGELLAIALGDQVPTRIRFEAMERLRDEASHERVVLTEAAPMGMRERALEHIRNNDTLYKIAGNSAAFGLWKLAIEQITDDRLLVQVIERCGDMEMQDYAADQMRDLELLVQTAQRLDREILTDQVIRRLKKLGDHTRIQRLLLSCSNLSKFPFSNYISIFQKHPEIITEIMRQAKNADLRIEALCELLKQNVSAELELEAHEMLRQELQLDRTQGNSSGCINELLKALPADIPLADDERAAMYALFTGEDQKVYGTSHRAAEYLASAGDTVGQAIYVFFDKLLVRNCLMAEADYAKLLEIPADLALDFLLQFKKNAFSTNMLSAPRNIMGSVAKATRLLHESGRAEKRIEQELPSSQSFSISYGYQDSDGDIHDEMDNFTVTFWQNEG